MKEGFPDSSGISLGRKPFTTRVVARNAGAQSANAGNVFYKTTDETDGFVRGGFVRSVNVKRIAATALGAAMVGAAFAGAVAVDPTLANFKFFDGGSPNVKVVVGAASQASDAVAAANIAAMIGNLAYTSKDVTVLGTDQLSCGGGAGGACSVSGKTTTLTVTTPGISPDVAYAMKSYVGGYLDYSSIDDRSNSMTGVAQILPQVSSTGTVTDTGGRKVTNYESPAIVKTYTITDSSVSKSYTEDERYYFYAYSAYDTSAKAVKAKNVQVGYEVQFTNPIQLCTETTPDYALLCSDTYLTSKHRVKIKFLGQDWVIYGMNNFLSTIAQTASSTNIVIGKEVQYKEFMQIGDEVTAQNGVKIKLTDISGIATGTQYQPPVSFKVYDANGNEIDTATLQQGGTDEYNKNGVVIHLWKAFAGIGQTAYAQVSIFSDKLTLTTGTVIDASNTQWQVTLVGGGSAYGDSLSRIQLARVVVDDLNAGDSVSFIQKPQIMKFTYTGLENVLYDTLSLGTGERSFPTSFPTTSTDTTTTGQSYVRVSSSLTNPFDWGTARTNTFYFITDATPAGAAVPGSVFYQDPSTGYFTQYNNTAETGWRIYAAASTFGLTRTAGATGLTIQNRTAVGSGTYCDGVKTVSSISGATVVNATVFTANDTYAAPLDTYNNVVQSINVTNAGGSLTVTLANGSTVVCTATTTDYYHVTVPAGIAGTFTGGTFNYTTNYVPYTYASTTVNIKLDEDGVELLTTVGHPDYTTDAIFFPEYTTAEDSATYLTEGAIAYDVAGGSTSSPYLGPSSGTAYVQYNASYVQANTIVGTSYESGLVTQRGSKATVSLTSATLNYATSIARALYTLSGSEVTAGNTADKQLKEGETALDESGYKVVVKTVDCNAAGGTTGTTGGTCSGAENLAPSENKAYVVTALDTSTSPLVVTDTSPLAAGTQPLIVVGGHLVNSVAASALSGAGVTIDATTEPMVKVIGDKIVVAGWSAGDTMSAANSLIQWFAANKDTLQR